MNADAEALVNIQVELNTLRRDIAELVAAMRATDINSVGLPGAWTMVRHHLEQMVTPS